MRVWMYPKTSKTNKYNELLSNSIEKNGLKVENFKQRKLLSVKSGDIIHFHWPHSIYQSRFTTILIFKSLLLLLIIKVMRLKGVKFVWTIHNLYPHKYKYKKIEKLVRNLIIKNVNIILTCGESIKKEVMNEYRVSNEKIKVVLHGSYLGVYQNQNRDIKEKFMIPSDHFVYLFLGAIKPYKGIDDLIYSFSSLKSNKSSLIIAGKPSEEFNFNKYKEIASDNIIFDLRFIPDEEIADYLTGSNAVVLPYKDITTSGSALLALSFNKYIVAPDTPFLREYFDENTSILYDRNDELGLTNSLKMVMQENINKSYFEKKLENISWSKIGKELTGIYKEL